jgi:membrane protease YdiL (CAAX protease family)
MMKSLFNLKIDRFGCKTILHAVMGVVVFFAGSLLSALPIDLLHSITKSEASALTIAIRCALNMAITLPLVYLYIVKGFKLPLSDFRIRRPKSVAVWILCAAALPLAVSGFFVLLVPGSFGVSGLSDAQILRRVATAVLGSCMVAGITEELIFRGFIMRLAEIRWNKCVAAIVPSVLFALLHVSGMANPNIADILRLLVAGTGVGVMFSMIAYHSGSIWPGAIVHGIWNLIIIGGILRIDVAPARSVFTYTLLSDSALLTGGAFGIEASLPAVTGYCIVIVLTWFFRRKASAIER